MSSTDLMVTARATRRRRAEVHPQRQPVDYDIQKAAHTRPDGRDPKDDERLPDQLHHGDRDPDRFKFDLGSPGHEHVGK